MDITDEMVEAGNRGYMSASLSGANGPNRVRAVLQAALPLIRAADAERIARLEGELAEARHFLNVEVDRAPEPVRRLGEWLSRVLDEDDWKTAERMLNGIVAAAPAPPSTQEPSP